MRFATAACMQKYGNVSFATVACAKCMRYGGRGGDPYHGGGGGWQHGTRNHIYKSMKPIALSIAVSWKFDSPTESQVFAAGAQGATVSRLPAV